MGSLFASKGYSRLAEAFFLKILKRSFQNKNAYIELDKIHGIAEQFDQSISIWKAGLILDPTDQTLPALIEKAGELQANIPKNQFTED